MDVFAFVSYSDIGMARRGLWSGLRQLQKIRNRASREEPWDQSTSNRDFNSILMLGRQGGPGTDQKAVTEFMQIHTDSCRFVQIHAESCRFVPDHRPVWVGNGVSVWCSVRKRGFTCIM